MRWHNRPSFLISCYVVIALFGSGVVCHLLGIGLGCICQLCRVEGGCIVVGRVSWDFV